MASGAKSGNSLRNPIYVREEDVLDQNGILTPLPINSRTNKYGYDVVRLKKHVCFFRGGAKAGTDVPAFFGTLGAALTYAHGNQSTLYGYVVLKEPRLFELSYANLVKLFDEDERLTPIEKAALDQYLVVSEDTPPYVVPTIYLQNENKPTATSKGIYLNRRILNIICRLGYDGWVVRPKTVLQRNIDMAHYKETGEIRYVLNPYEGEVALCHWDQFMKEVKIPAA